MTWEEKFNACTALNDISLHMRSPGDWYVNHTGVERKEGDFLSGGCVRNAKTPEEAIEKHWNWLTDPKFHIVLNAHGQRREGFWNGYMWKDWN